MIEVDGGVTWGLASINTTNIYCRAICLYFQILWIRCFLCSRGWVSRSASFYFFIFSYNIGDSSRAKLDREGPLSTVPPPQKEKGEAYIKSIYLKVIFLIGISYFIMYGQVNDGEVKVHPICFISLNYQSSCFTFTSKICICLCSHVKVEKA